MDTVQVGGWAQLGIDPLKIGNHRFLFAWSIILGERCAISDRTGFNSCSISVALAGPLCLFSLTHPSPSRLQLQATSHHANLTFQTFASYSFPKNFRSEKMEPHPMSRSLLFVFGGYMRQKWFGAECKSKDS